MKLRPIIFSGPMVRAILDGRKTQTRRLIKPQPVGFVEGVPCSRIVRSRGGNVEEYSPIRCPFGAVGDGLWVRETWQPTCRTGCAQVYLPATNTFHEVPVGRVGEVNSKWKSWEHRTRSPILMPRWASRLTLVVRSVRVERLSAITEEDARAEGVGGCVDCGTRRDLGAYRCDFLDGFRTLNKLAADADPWLWVVGFERMEAAR